MTLWEALSLLLGPVAGWFAAGLLWPELRRDAALLRLSFGALLGWGLISLLFFLFRHVLGLGMHPLVWESAAVLLLVAASRLRKRPGPVLRRLPPARAEGFRLLGVPGLLEGLFGLTLLAAGNMQMLLVRALPGGAWDAYGQWNMRARQLLAEPGCFETALYTSGHGDYPLFIPALIARTWSFGPGPDYMTPAVVAVLMSAALLSLLISGVATFRGRATGLVAGMALMGTWLFLRLGAYQYADLPLAACVLATAVALCAAGKGRGGWLMAGAMAGLAVWTKNEGSVFLAVIAAGIIIASALTRQNLRAATNGMGRFLTGGAPFLLMTLHFKTAWAPGNTLAKATTSEAVLGKFSDLARHGEVLQTFAKELFLFHRWGWAPLVLVALLLLLRWQRPGEWGRGLLAGWIGVLLLLVAYYVVYVLTPRELTWHMATSLNRLVMHAWPCLIFLAMASTELPDWPGRKGSALRGD